MLTSGLIVVRVVEKSHLDTIQDSMLRELHLLATQFEWPLEEDIEEKIAKLTVLTERIMAISGERVTFIEPDGTVVGDSNQDPYAMDNHALREEIQQAEREGIGYTVRYSDTLKQDMLYAALRLPLDGEETKGFIRLAVELDDIQSTTHRLWMILAAGLLAYVFIAGVISYRIAGGLTRPLEQAVDAAKRIARLELQTRVTATSKDEFGQLAEAINAMADSLQQQLSEIRKGEIRLNKVLNNLTSGVILIDHSGVIRLFNRSAEEMLGYPEREVLGTHYHDIPYQNEIPALIDLCFKRHERVSDDITVYYPQERILEFSLSPMDEPGGRFGVVIVMHDITAIRRLERMRSEFVSNVSHELRTPITAVRGFAETLLSGAMNDKDTAFSFLTIIYEESNRLGRLIEETLDLSQIESKQTSMKFVPVELDGLVRQTLETVRSAADKRRIQLEYDAVSELFIEADEDRLRQILLNLLSNAINYTLDGGRVKLTIKLISGDDNSAASIENDRVQIRIQDTGIGIPKKDLPRIFERFYRVDKARSRSSGGTGLGLSIVKHLVEMHHGSIRVESMVGVGSTFIIELPLVQD